MRAARTHCQRCLHVYQQQGHHQEGILVHQQQRSVAMQGDVSSTSTISSTISSTSTSTRSGSAEGESEQTGTVVMTHAQRPGVRRLLDNMVQLIPPDPSMHTEFLVNRHREMSGSAEFDAQAAVQSVYECDAISPSVKAAVALSAATPDGLHLGELVLAFHEANKFEQQSALEPQLEQCLVDLESVQPAFENGLARILAVALECGNFMNFGTDFTSTTGLYHTSYNKVVAVKDQDGRRNLLDFIIETCSEHHPDAVVSAKQQLKALRNHLVRIEEFKTAAREMRPFILSSGCRVLDKLGYGYQRRFERLEWLLTQAHQRLKAIAYYVQPTGDVLRVSDDSIAYDIGDILHSLARLGHDIERAEARLKWRTIAKELQQPILANMIPNAGLTAFLMQVENSGRYMYDTEFIAQLSHVLSSPEAVIELAPNNERLMKVLIEMSSDKWKVVGSSKLSLAKVGRHYHFAVDLTNV
eukprot:GFYU01003012.1.p1 GENE.GFYU01003012.1~~GFYU01003012.1.p1  ORF type:complete len:470 (+),score=134.21 GFYU01003012.1:407-1816(+)